MKAHFARERQQAKCLLQIHGFGGKTFWNAGTLRLLAIAQLHIGTEASRLQRYFFTGLRIDAERAGRCVAAVLIAATQLARVAAFRIIRAADKGPELSEFQVEAAASAGRATARIAAVFALREHMRPENF